MAKKTTLKEIGDTVAHVVKHMATKENLEKLATKDHIFALHTQVNSIETQLRGMNYVKIEERVATLEEKVFGEARLPGRSRGLNYPHANRQRLTRPLSPSLRPLQKKCGGKDGEHAEQRQPQRNRLVQDFVH
jgi:hypothetical protein